MPVARPALLRRMPIRRTNEQTAGCNSVPKLYRSVFMRLSSWIIAARPQTLSLSTTPVIVGTALAWAVERQIRWPAVLAALIGSMLIQIGTNLHNDAADSKRGGDGPDRVGPPRATASGLLDGAAVNRAACACFAAAALMGAYLVWVGGWPIFLLGIASILSGWAYTGGALPIAYTPLGELFVVAFLAWVPCAAPTGYAPGNSPASIEAGLAVGLLTGAVLLVNNHRDAEADARVGRRTLAILAGPNVTTLDICRADAGAVRAAPSDRTGAPRTAMCGRRSSHCRWSAC